MKRRAQEFGLRLRKTASVAGRLPPEAAAKFADALVKRPEGGSLVAITQPLAPGAM